MLQGRAILVTGAARGLGAEIARSLAEKGADLVLADIAVEEGRAVAGELGARFLPVDLGDPGSIAALGERLTGDGRCLHGLVNNGAIATGVGGISFDEIEIESWDRVMRVNVRGIWLMTRAVAPLLKLSGSGRIVNVASDTALWGALVVSTLTLAVLGWIAVARWSAHWSARILGAVISAAFGGVLILVKAIISH